MYFKDWISFYLIVWGSFHKPSLLFLVGQVSMVQTSAIKRGNVYIKELHNMRGKPNELENNNDDDDDDNNNLPV